MKFIDSTNYVYRSRWLLPEDKKACRIFMGNSKEISDFKKSMKSRGLLRLSTPRRQR